MARRKKARRKEEKRPPDWAKAIQELYEVLGCGTQEEFAARLRFKQGTVSTWLRGDETRKPSADTLIRMAGFAPKPDLASRFLGLANISDEAISAVARKLASDRLRKPAPLIEKGDVFLVPPYRETAQGREEAGSSIPLPTEFIPNRDSTCFLVLDEDCSGHLLDAGDILILERNSGDQRKPAPFFGQTILANLAPSLEGVVSAFWPKGLVIGKLGLHPFAGSREGKEERNAAIRAIVAQIGRPDMRSWNRDLEELIVAAIQESAESAEGNSWMVDLEPLNYRQGMPLIIGYHRAPQDSDRQTRDQAKDKDRKVESSAKDDTREKARNEMLLEEGASILGRVLGWFHSSSRHLREVPDGPMEQQK